MVNVLALAVGTSGNSTNGLCFIPVIPVFRTPVTISFIVDSYSICTWEAWKLVPGNAGGARRADLRSTLESERLSRGTNQVQLKHQRSAAETYGWKLILSTM